MKNKIAQIKLQAAAKEKRLLQPKACPNLPPTKALIGLLAFSVTIGENYPRE